MPSSDGHDRGDASSPMHDISGRTESVEAMLFESLVHHLIEKGLLTKNDALSVVQTVAQVRRGQLAEALSQSAELTMLQRLYESFEAMRERPGAPRLDGENVRQLRPPLHHDQPEFPQQD